MTRESSSPTAGLATSPVRQLGHEDAAIFETFVVPKYLSFFGEPLVEMLAPGRDARVCHVHCRTGYPDRTLIERLPNAHVFGCDGSPYAVELARSKAAALPRGAGSGELAYHVADSLPLAFPAGAFSHAFTIHPLAAPSQRRHLLDELGRLVAPRGQALIAMPLRGSFAEVADLLRECALKNERVELTNAVEAAAQLRPTAEALQRELEAAGFEYIEVETSTRTLRFDGGRSFFEDPITRLLIVPEFRVDLALDSPSLRTLDPLGYVRDAIDEYWSDGSFEVTVNVGVVGGRRRS